MSQLSHNAAAHELSDRELLRRYSEQHDQTAFATLGARYTKMVFRLCVQELRNRSDAEDATQAVFLLLAQKAARLKHHTNLSGWLFQAVRYVASNHRKQERRRLLREETADKIMRKESETVASSPNRLWEELEPHLHQALTHLKPADRDAVLLRFWGDYSYAQVGQALGITENALRMRIERAVQRLGNHLREAGIALSGAALLAALENRAASASTPDHLIETVATLGNSLPVGSSFLPTTPYLLAEGASKSMLLATIAQIATVALLGTIAIGGVYRVATGTAGVFGASVSDTTRAAFVTPFLGTWQGTLTYRDFFNGQRISTPVTITATPSDKKRALTWSARYPRMHRTDTEQWTVDPRTGRFVQTVDGKREESDLTGLEAFAPSGQGRLSLYQSSTSGGSDDGKPADIRTTIQRENDTLTIRREARPRGTSSWEYRNEYQLRRAGAQP